MSLQMQGHGLCFVDFNQAKYTIQQGPFRTREEVDLEELLQKPQKMGRIWSCIKCNQQEYQEITSKWALCSVPQWSYFSISKISDLFLLWSQRWETHCAQSISPPILQAVVLTLGNVYTVCPGKLLSPKQGCNFMLVCPYLLTRN